MYELVLHKKFINRMWKIKKLRSFVVEAAELV